MNKIISNPMISLDNDGVVDTCPGCGCLLTDYEKRYGTCRDCRPEDIRHPDDRCDEFRGRA